MTKKQFESLSVGDLIRPLTENAEGVIVTANLGETVVTARTTQIPSAQHDEWELVKKAHYKAETP